MFNESCQVDPLDQDDTIEWSNCVDDEVRIDIRIECTLAEDGVSVNVKTEARMFEETTCANNDSDGFESRAVLVSPCGDSCTPVSLNSPGEGSVLEVTNEDEGGDFAEIRVTVSNGLQP